MMEVPPKLLMLKNTFYLKYIFKKKMADCILRSSRFDARDTGHFSSVSN